MKTIAIMNNKGGVGKTVTAVNLADILVRRYRKRVLLVDCDGQMNLTRFYLPEFDPEVSLTLAEVVRQGEKLVRELGVPVFRTVIRRTDKVPESTFDRQPIVQYSPRSAAAKDYLAWAREYIGPFPEAAETEA